MTMGPRIPNARRSILANVVSRQHGHCGEHSFERNVARSFEQKVLLRDPEIVSPHTASVSSLSVDGTTGRFLLAGSSDATISVYDLSPWGRERHPLAVRTTGVGMHPHERDDGDLPPYRPVARSVKVPAVADVLELPGGHSSSITHVQWYPTDAGAFLSTSSDGTILLWDTHRMTPVLRVRPFTGDDDDDDVATAGWVSAHLRKVGTDDGDRHPPLLVAGSWYAADLRLVDIRSGASSHRLVGHQSGISAVQWSPTNPHVLASGSRDSTVRLWDIRKSGSRACITVLDRDRVVGGGGGTPSLGDVVSGPYASDYSHLRRAGPSSSATLASRGPWVPEHRSNHGDSNKRRRLRELSTGGRHERNHPLTAAPMAAPNNYDQWQFQQSRSHNGGHVAALAFFESGQHLVSAGGADGEVMVWDLRTGCSEPSRFVAPGGLPATQPKQRRVALAVDGSTGTTGTTIWVGRKEDVLGFGREGGSPRQTLRGHLSNVSCLSRMEPGRRLLSGSKDGMILCWGQQPQAAVAMGGPATSEDADNW